jgi:prefoldin beta subunit
MNKEQENKIAELQILEQNIQNLLQQKQKFQTDQIEVENALLELNKTTSNPYKVINGIMFESTTEDLKKELTTKKETSNIRMKNIEKQEELLRKKAEALQKEVMEELKPS